MPDITAHRAGAARGPENSLQALAQAIAYGTQWAEIDVQLTLDGTVVVFHDADLLRLAGDPRRIGEVRFAELPALKGGVRIPSLTEFIANARGRIRLNIELKDYGAGDALPVQVAAILQAQGFLDQAAACSFSPALVAGLKQAAPELLVGHVLDARELPDGAADFVSVAARHVTPDLVHAAHSRGMAVHAWTANTQEEILRLLATGVDHVITDDPALGLETVRRYRGLSPWRRAWLRWRT